MARHIFNPASLQLEEPSDSSSAGPTPIFFWHPNMICTSLTEVLFKDVPPLVLWYAKQARREEGLRIYGVKQKRGRSYRRADGQTAITIPEHAFARGVEYKTYYIAHELAHFYDRNLHGHGPEFYVWFKDICPPELWHHELPYKPYEARAAAITTSPTMNRITKWGREFPHLSGGALNLED